MKNVTITWEKRLRANQFDDNIDYLKHGGVYLWIWPGKKERICYVGEAKKFRERFKQHFSMLLGGLYTVFNMTKKDDFVEFLKNHYHDKEFKEINRDSYIYIPVFNGEQAVSDIFERAFIDSKWQDVRRNYLNTLEFVFGQVEVDGKEADSKARREVEGALINSLRQKYDEIAQTTLRLRNWRKPQIPIGNINRYPTDDMIIQHTGQIETQLPEELRSIKRYSIN